MNLPHNAIANYTAKHSRAVIAQMVQHPDRYESSLASLTRAMRHRYPVSENAPAGPLQGIAEYAFDRIAETMSALAGYPRYP